MACFVRTTRPSPPAQRDTQRLAVRNAHPRDALIAFDEGDHAYFVLHEPTRTFLRAPVSVSGMYKRFFGSIPLRDSRFPGTMHG